MAHHNFSISKQRMSVSIGRSCTSTRSELNKGEQRLIVLKLETVFNLVIMLGLLEVNWRTGKTLKDRSLLIYSLFVVSPCFLLFV